MGFFKKIKSFCVLLSLIKALNSYILKIGCFYLLGFD